MRHAVLILLLATVVVLEGQPSPDLNPTLREQLEQLFPTATTFSSKEGAPPHFKAYEGTSGSGERTVTGYAFWTTELEPLERGYDGPIQILVGVDLSGLLTGIVVVRHHEPYGYFSVDTPEFAAQFVRKDIRERFRVGDDIDAISTATLTVTSATRAVRNAARRIARQFLVPSGSQ
ncbi:MAG: FMN-binding protein [Vicinamibacterales bacterium]|jgi:NosR/NirI family nitrous oxide reductase transcriptional regulator|nr:FMN-binding protein [Vicinamibacterales bacterium]